MGCTRGYTSVLTSGLGLDSTPQGYKTGFLLYSAQLIVFRYKTMAFILQRIFRVVDEPFMQGWSLGIVPQITTGQKTTG